MVRMRLYASYLLHHDFPSSWTPHKIPWHHDGGLELGFGTSHTRCGKPSWSITHHCNFIFSSVERWCFVVAVWPNCMMTPQFQYVSLGSSPPYHSLKAWPIVILPDSITITHWGNPLPIFGGPQAYLSILAVLIFLWDWNNPRKMYHNLHGLHEGGHFVGILTNVNYIGGAPVSLRAS